MPGEPAPAAADAALRRRAAAHLGLDPDSTVDSARPGLLGRVASANFLPDPADHAAILALAGRPCGPAPGAGWRGSAEEGQYRMDVEEFAARFFALPVADRRARWAELDRAGADFPATRDRLRRLEPGLDVDPARVEGRSPLARPLADAVLMLFVAPAAARPMLARELTYSIAQDKRFSPRQRGAAVRELRRRHPEVATLRPDFLDAVRGLRPARPRSAAAGKPGLRLSDVFNRDRPMAWYIAVAVAANAARVAFDSSRTGSPTVTTAAAPVRPAPPRFVPPPPSPAAVPFRARFGEALRRELARGGTVLDDPTWEKIVAALPDPGPGPPAAPMPPGQDWPAAQREVFVGGVEATPRRVGIIFDEKRFDRAVRAALDAVLAGRVPAPVLVPGMPAAPRPDRGRP